MIMSIHPLLPDEQKYTYSQSRQLEGQTGLIGHLRGALETTGSSFLTSWDDHNAQLNTQDFKTCFDEVINALRSDASYDLILRNRATLAGYCHTHPESSFGNGREYGIRVDTTNYTMLMRLNPNVGEYNLYCYCYVREWLDKHLSAACHGIRFITPDYQEIFHIPDGDRIRIFTADGEMRDRICRYIDDYHMETADGFSTTIYHIAEFAERCEQADAAVIPLRSSLPEKCFSVSEYSNDLIEVTKGLNGYSIAEKDLGSLTPREAADRLNRELGVSKAQERAMVMGSMFGWAVPGADPDNYPDDKTSFRSPRNDRGDAR